MTVAALAPSPPSPNGSSPTLAAIEPRPWRPRLAIAADGGVRMRASGGFQWIVHPGPVAFLAAPLAGLTGDEAVCAQVRIEPAARATLTTQGPTVLLTTRQTARQAWRLDIAEDATGWLLPWVTIPLPGSRARLCTDVQLAAGAAFVGWDLLAVGRVARGERFELERLRSDSRLAAGDRLLLLDRFDLRGREREHLSALMGGRTHLASMYLAGFGRALTAADVRDCLGPDDELLLGVSGPDPDLVVVRALGDRAEALERRLWPVVEAAARARDLPAPAAEAVARRWNAVTEARPDEEEDPCA